MAAGALRSGRPRPNRHCRRRSPGRRRDRPARPVADTRSRSARASRLRDGHQQRVGRARWVVGTRRFLPMGDVEQEIDPQPLAAGLTRVDLLKVAHHGSRTATTQGFVDTVRPRIAVASAGAGNPYGHPTRVTLERLANAGARVLNRLQRDRRGDVRKGRPSRLARRGPSCPGNAAALLFRVGGGVPLCHPGDRDRSGTGGRNGTHGAETLGFGRDGRPGRAATVGTIEAMTVPGRVEAASSCCPWIPHPGSFGTRAPWPKVAGWLGGADRCPGWPSTGAEDAALLNVTRHCPLGSHRELPHERSLGGQADLGWRARPAVAGHPVTHLRDGERFRRWAAFASREERIVAYADKRAGQRSNDGCGFASWRRRYPPMRAPGSTGAWDDATFTAVRARASRLEAATSAGSRAWLRPMSAGSHGRVRHCEPLWSLANREAGRASR